MIEINQIPRIKQWWQDESPIASDVSKNAVFDLPREVEKRADREATDPIEKLVNTALGRIQGTSKESVKKTVPEIGFEELVSRLRPQDRQRLARVIVEKLAMTISDPNACFDGMFPPIRVY